ncbi:MAG: hypothetical protein ACOCV2_06755 [Persicimonas sp.]
MPESTTQEVHWPARRSAWTLVVALLGLSLWAQLFALPLYQEFGFADASGAVIFAYIAPLLAWAAGAIWRNSAVVMLVFPLAVIPGIFALPEPSVAQLEQLGGMARIGVTLLAYVAVAAVSFGGASTGPSERSDERDARRVDGLYPFYFGVRALILLVLLVVTQYAAFYDPTIAEAVAEHYSKRPEAATSFIGLFIFFAWCVAAYTTFVVPLMNVEYDVRRLHRDIGELVDGGRRARFLRIGAWTVVAGAALVILGLVA